MENMTTFTELSYPMGHPEFPKALASSKHYAVRLLMTLADCGKTIKYNNILNSSRVRGTLGGCLTILILMA